MKQYIIQKIIAIIGIVIKKVGGYSYGRDGSTSTITAGKPTNQSAQQAVLDAQGSDAELLQQAFEQLQQAEQGLEQVQNEAGAVAIENPQFQQAYEQLHDTRQQVQEAQQNNDEVL